MLLFILLDIDYVSKKVDGLAFMVGSTNNSVSVESN